MKAVETTSTWTRKSLGGLDGQSFPLIGPPERLGHGAIVVVNESQDFGLQILDRCERTATEQLADQDREPDRNLAHPGAMIGGVMKDDLVGGIAQERCPPRHEGQDAIFPFLRKPEPVATADSRHHCWATESLTQHRQWMPR